MLSSILIGLAFELYSCISILLFPENSRLLSLYSSYIEIGTLKLPGVLGVNYSIEAMTFIAPSELIKFVVSDLLTIAAMSY